MRNSLEPVTKFCILAGIITHPIWAWSFKATFIPKPSDFFFALAMVGSILYSLGEGRTELAKIPKLLYAAILLFGTGIFLATIAGYIRYDIPVGGWHLILYHIFRIGGGFILALFVYACLSQNARFARRLSFSFLASAAPFMPFLFLPDFAEKLGILEQQGRFLGLAGNTGMFAVLIFPAFVFALFFFLRQLFSKEIQNQPRQILFFGFLWLAATALILWSGARSYFGAMVLAALVGVPAVGYLYRVAPKKILIVWVLVISALFIGLLFSPTLYKFRVLSNNPAIAQESAKQIEQIEHYAELQIKGEDFGVQPVPLTGSEGRWLGFQYYLSLLKADPLIFLLGVGINNERKFNLFFSIGDGELFAFGRSIIFDIFLYGGMMAGASVLLLVWMIIQRIKTLFATWPQDQIYVLASAVTLLGWWTAAIFLGTPFTLIPNWVLLGMILASPQTLNSKS